MYKVLLPTIYILLKNFQKNMCYAKYRWKNTKNRRCYWMAKITFVVRELNKPSQLALTNLSQLVYCLLDTCSENNTTTKSDSAEKTIEMEKTA